MHQYFSSEQYSAVHFFGAEDSVLLYLLRNPILQCSFLFPWSETSFPGVSTMNQTQKCRCYFSTNNNTYMMISGLSSQPGAPSRRSACTLDLAPGGWDKDRLAGDGGGWVGRGRELFQTLWNLLVSHANEMEGQKDKKTCRKRWTQRGMGEREESGLLKQHFYCGNHSRRECQSRGLC